MRTLFEPLHRQFNFLTSLSVISSACSRIIGGSIRFKSVVDHNREYQPGRRRPSAVELDIDGLPDSI
jgi:hypothetical protein